VSDGFYSQVEWQKLRAKVKKQWRGAGLPCAHCGKVLDWATKAGVVVDHKINRKQRPDLAMEQDNLCCVHHECNTRKAFHVENNSRVEIGADGYPVGGGW
jgi:5-methylcytosine-specific restriction endonuclease McrA